MIKAAAGGVLVADPHGGGNLRRTSHTPLRMSLISNANMPILGRFLNLSFKWKALKWELFVTNNWTKHQTHIWCLLDWKPLGTTRLIARLPLTQTKAGADFQLWSIVLRPAAIICTRIWWLGVHSFPAKSSSYFTITHRQISRLSISRGTVNSLSSFNGVKWRKRVFDDQLR